MTTTEALEQAALEFEQRRTKLLDAIDIARRERRSARHEGGERASAAYETELQAQVRELTHVIDRLRERSLRLRDEEAA